MVLLDLGLFCRHVGIFVVWAARDVGRTMSFVGVGVFEEELGVAGVSSVVMVLECVCLLTAGGLGPIPCMKHVAWVLLWLDLTDYGTTIYSSMYSEFTSTTKQYRSAFCPSCCLS